MKLPSELISQFVKITKDVEPNKKETIVYGNAVVEKLDDGTTQTYVQIDGSDKWTPVNTSAIIKATNKSQPARVTLMIKDHVATIIGCTSSPSARNEDVEKINADFGEAVSRTEFSGAVNRIKTLEYQNDVTKEAINTLDTEVNGLQMDVSEHDTRIATLENEAIVNWTDLTVNSDVFEAYSVDTKPRYKVNGNLVSVIGSVKPSSGVVVGSGVIASGIDEQHRPPMDLSFICPGIDDNPFSSTGVNPWILQITTAGVVQIARYGVVSNDSVPSDMCLTFAVTYSI